MPQEETIKKLTPDDIYEGGVYYPKHQKARIWGNDDRTVVAIINTTKGVVVEWTSDFTSAGVPARSGLWQFIGWAGGIRGKKR